MKLNPFEIWKKLSPAMKRYLVVGVSVYVLELLVIVIAQAAGSGNVLSVALAFWIGLLVSFALQKFVTFKDKRTQHTIVIAQFVAVALLVLFNFGFTLAVTQVLGQFIPAVICRTLALGVTTLWNFYLYKTRIFKNPGEPVY